MKEIDLRSKMPVPSLRKEIRDHLRGVLMKLRVAHEEKGRYPFEGKWLGKEQIEVKFLQLSRQERVVIIEVLLLSVGLLSISAVLYLILNILCCAQN